MDKLLFLYDKLMTQGEQSLIEVPMKLITCAQMQGKMYWFNDTKKRRLFVQPNQEGVSTKVVFGGLFLLKHYEFFQHKLHSYYYNCKPFAGETMKEDLYDLQKVLVRPIRFSGLLSLSKSDYEVGEPMEAECFVGNSENQRIVHSLTKRYYTTKSIDKNSFIEMIKENTK